MRTAAWVLAAIVLTAACATADEASPPVATGAETTATSGQAEETAATATSSPTDSAAACRADQPVVAPVLPADTTGPNAMAQSGVDCFAWQSFIALNWPSAAPGEPDPGVPPAEWGDPGDERTTVWQSYSAAPDVFRTDAAEPYPFGRGAPAPASCGGDPARVLTQDAKFSTAAHVDRLTGALVADPAQETLDEQLEATGQGLTDQQGNAVRYERRLNQVEYDYIDQAQLYNADTQLQVATDTGIALPDGAIEIKAAWRVLDTSGQGAADPDRYHAVNAYLYDAGQGTCTGPVTVGLVGLHVLRKTTLFPDLVWATFEHVDNAPDAGDPAPAAPGGGPWTFFDPDCADPCTPSWQDPPAADTPAGTPVQVERRFPVGAANSAVQDAIRAVNPDSVWQYYQLVNTLWFAGGAQPPPGPGATTPLNPGQFTSNNQTAVANTTMETYVQAMNCTGCHASAPVAATLGPGGQPQSHDLASDFSFLFSTACVPGQPCPLTAASETARGHVQRYLAARAG